MSKKACSLCLIVFGMLALTAIPLFVYAPPSSQITIGTPVTGPTSPSSTEPVVVTVNVTQSHPGIMNVSIVFTTDNWQSANTTIPAAYNSTLNSWVATIPPQNGGAHVQFYIIAYDFNSNKAVNNNSGTYFTYDIQASPIVSTTIYWLIAAGVIGGIGAFTYMVLRTTRHSTARPSNKTSTF